MAIFNEKFILDLPDDPMLAGYYICKELVSRLQRTEGDLPFEEYLETYAFLEAIAEENGLNWELGNIHEKSRRETKDILESSITIIYQQTKSYHERNEQEALVDKYKSKYRNSIKGAFIYEFSDGDLNQIQELINNLREKISISTLFDESHKRRILRRLEILQQEIHKKQSNLDHYWGLVGDAGVAIGKFGKDAKPFVELIKEITNIVWRTQAKAEELPSDSPSPLLTNEENEI